MKYNEKTDIEQIVDRLLTEAVTAGVMPGAVAGIMVVGNNSSRKRWISSSGFTARSKTAVKVTKHTVYDLASLTKPLVTVPCILTLVESGRINLDSTLSELLPFSEVPKDKKSICLKDLLGHCSGLPAHRPYYIEGLGVKKNERDNFVFQQILKEPLQGRPGINHVYSDLGFILLGKSIEQLTGESLHHFYQKNILIPLGLNNSLGFNAGIDLPNIKQCAATEVCPWTKKLLRGVVHDDNCRIMGGVAGHAGLFGTVEGVLTLTALMVEVWNNWRNTKLFSRELLQLFLTRFPGSTWTCGFDTPSLVASSSGNLFSPGSVGHLGFTGCSLWMDLKRGYIIVLLTNRVHPSRKNIQIRQFRPVFHDEVMRWLIGAQS